LNFATSAAFVAFLPDDVRVGQNAGETVIAAVDVSRRSEIRCRLAERVGALDLLMGSDRREPS
jgi:hypothetical protein